MLYYLLKPLIKNTFRVFFKKIYFTGISNIPRDHSVVYAVNHPTAFLDPIVVASILKPTLHFMLRGDIFTTALYRWLLAQIKTIPIFRFRDGFSNLKNNQDTMALVYEKLNAGDNILILAEGIAKHEKKMRPIQKGTARMVFGTYDKYQKDDLVIIPVGVNYTDSDAFRSMLMVDFGAPIYIKDYLESYTENPRKAINEMTTAISQSMSERIIHIEKDEDAAFTNGLLKIKRNSAPQTVLPIIDLKNRGLLEQELQITETINEMEESPKQALKGKVLAYFSQLKSLKISDLGLAQTHRYSLKNSLILVIGFIPFILGLVLNFLPLRLAKWVADRTVKKIEFHSSIRFGVGMLGYLFYFLILLILASVFLSWSGVAWVFCMPIFGFFSLIYRDFFQSWNAARAVSKVNPEKIMALQKIRRELLQWNQ